MLDYCVIAVDRGCHEKLLHIRAASLEAAREEALRMGMVRVDTVFTSGVPASTEANCNASTGE